MKKVKYQLKYHFKSSRLKKASMYLLAFLVMSAITLILFNSSLDNDTTKEKFNFSQGTSIKILLFTLAFLAGLNEFFEIIDHMLIPDSKSGDARKRGAKLEISHDTSICQDRIKFICRATTTTFLSPMMLSAGYAIFTQSIALTHSFGISSPLKRALIVIPTTLILWLRFVIIPVTHTTKNIWGGRSKYIAEVIGADEDIRTNLKIKIPLFILFCGTHLVESFLLSEAIDRESTEWLKIHKNIIRAIEIMSIVGLTTCRAIAHSDHAEALLHTYEKWQGYRTSYRCLTIFTSLISACAHAAPAALGTIHYWHSFNSPFIKLLMSLSILVEAFTGSLEHLQHGARYYIRCLSSKLSAQDKKSPTTSEESQILTIEQMHNQNGYGSNTDPSKHIYQVMPT